MKIRKVFAGIVVVLNIVLIVGCSRAVESISEVEYDKNEVLKMYNTVIDNIEDFSSVKVKVSTDCFMNNGINSIQINMLTDIQHKAGENGLEMQMNSCSAYQDKKFETDSYYINGHFYTDFNDKKNMYSLTEEDMKKDSAVFPARIDSEYIEYYNVESTNDGDVSITLEAAPESINSIVEKYIVDIFRKNPEHMKVSKFKVNLISDSEMIIKSCDTLISMKYENGGEYLEYTVDSFMEYYGINKPVDIVYPDFSEYVEVDM